MNYPWNTNDLTMDDAWLTHGPPLKANGQLMGDPWIKYVFQRQTNVRSMDYPWTGHGRSTGNSQATRGIHMGYPWATYMVYPWASCGQHMDDPWVKTKTLWATRGIHMVDPWATHG